MSDQIVDVVVVEGDPVQAVSIVDAGPGAVAVEVADGVVATGPQGQPGPIGPTGPAGPAIAWGGRPPNNLDGAAGASWIDTSRDTLYGPKAGNESMFANLTTGAGINAGPLELGMVFTVTSAGRITALKFWRCSNETVTTRTLSLWKYGQTTAIATVLTTAETGTGWMTYPLATPVDVTPGDYVVSYEGAGFTARVSPVLGTLGIEPGNIRSRVSVYGTTLKAYPNNFHGTQQFLADVVFTETVKISTSMYLANDAPVSVGHDNVTNFEYGIRFRALLPVKVTGLRFYRAATSTQTTRTLNLWSSSGTLLASATTSGETGSGWFSVNLATPYTLVAGTEYVVSYGTLSTSDYGYTLNKEAPPPNAALVYLWGIYATAQGGFPTTYAPHPSYVDIVGEYDSPWPSAIAGGRVKVDAYTIPGNYTWIKPPGAKLVRVVCHAGGGGGGSGCRHPSTTNRSGGSGGGGGARTETVFAAADLPASVALTVGAGGAGGAAVTADNTNGNTGGLAAASYFGSFPITLWMPGAPAGGGGGMLNAAAGLSSGPVGTMSGGAGNSGAAGGGANYPGFLNISAWGGGGGGGASAANAVFAGGVGFSTPLTYGYAVNAAGAGGVTGGNGANATYAPTTPEPWPTGSGGGGGGAGSAGVGGNGGNGIRGGGGGGGGCSANGFNSGAGGKGGDGFVQVITYF